MRILGLDRIAAYACHCGNSAEAEILRAWLSELRHKTWSKLGALAKDFRDVDISAPPKVVFYPVSARIRIDTLVDFRTAVILVTDIGPTASRGLIDPTVGNQTK